MVLFPQGSESVEGGRQRVGLDLEGTYLNLDGGFDSAHNRKCIFNAGIIPNIPENPRNRSAQAWAQAALQRRHPCLTPVCRAHLCVGGQI